MDKMEERRQWLEEKIVSLRSRLEKLEAQKEETEQAIEEERRRKNEERRGAIADTVEKVFGEIPEDEIPSFEEFLKLFRETYAPQITITPEEDDDNGDGADFFSGGDEADVTDEEKTNAEKLSSAKFTYVPSAEVPKGKTEER